MVKQKNIIIIRERVKELKMKKIIALLLTLVMTTALFIGCAPQNALLEINGKKTATLEEIKFFVYSFELQVGEEGMSEPNPEGEGTIGDYVRQQAMDTVIALNLVKHVALEKGLKATDAELKKAAEDAEKYFSQIDPEEAKAKGITKELFERILTNYVYYDKLMENLIPDAEIDQEQLKSDLQYYEITDNKYALIKSKGYEEAAKKVTVKHILLKTVDENMNPLAEDAMKKVETKAKEVLAKAKANEDFAALVKEYSEDTGSVSTNGEITFGRGEMVPEFEEKAFSMKDGEISDLVKTVYGYHIIKLEKASLKPTAEEIEVVKAYEKEIEMNAKRSQKGMKFQEKIEELKKEYKIVINDKIWNSYEVTGQTKKDAAKSTEKATEAVTQETSKPTEATTEK